MPAKKKTETVEETKEETTFRDDYRIPVVDYKVIPIEDVPKFMLDGYTLVGGATTRYNSWYQAVIYNTVRTVSKEEYEDFWKAHPSTE